LVGLGWLDVAGGEECVEIVFVGADGAVDAEVGEGAGEP
jgi:hypothetical protein